MELEFREYDGSCFALNPRIERRADQLIMKLDEQSCTHFLLFSQTPNGTVDLNVPSLQEQLINNKDALLDATDEPLSDDIAVSCISYKNYRMNDYAINLPQRIAEYTVVGCKLAKLEEPQRLRIFIPQPQMSFSANVSLTAYYRVSPYAGDESRIIQGKHGINQPLCVVEFDDIPNYQDGGIVYRIEGIPYAFPITRDMVGGKKIYIDASSGLPKFETTVSGLVIKKK